jgi:hypothetical protein
MPYVVSTITALAMAVPLAILLLLSLPSGCLPQILAHAGLLILGSAAALVLDRNTGDSKLPKVRWLK